ncbi:Adenylyl-sulfate kinase, chloroplastic [Glycine soja]
MTTAKAPRPPCRSGVFRNIVCGPSPAAETLGFPRLRGISVAGLHRSRRNLVLRARSKPIKVKENATVSASLIDDWFKPITAKEDSDAGKNLSQMSNVANSTNIMWHDCPIQKQDRQQLLQQKGCVIWLTGLSGSGKSTIACALSRSLHSKGKLSYILDGDNIRHGLNQDLSFRAEDRSENIRRIGEVAKLFADAGVICITSLISPYQKDRDACRALMPKGDFIEMFHYMCVKLGTQRDSTSLLELERSKIVLQQKGSNCKSPSDMAEEVISYLEENGYLRA